MPVMLRIVFTIYEVCIALPILIVVTTVAALLSAILAPWANKTFANWPARLWARIFCYVLFVRVHLHGAEHIRAGRSYVFASNHQSFFDIWAIYGWLPVVFKWVMKSSLRKIPLVGWACERIGHIFINRESAIAAKNSLQKAGQMLQNGVSVVIFPEGTRSADGQLGTFKRGGFLLATHLRMNVIPVTLIGCHERMPKGTLHITPGTIDIYIHPEVDITPYDKEDQSKLANDVRSIIAAELACHG